MSDWYVIKETKEYVQYQRPKQFSILSFILLTVCFNVFGLFGYLVYYWNKKPFEEYFETKGRR